MRMNGDANLVASLVDRLATRLPHRTGSNCQDLGHDELVVLTRATLLNISNTCIEAVCDALLSLLEELSRPYKAINTHPSHILHSELYITHLLANCFSAHWQNVNLQGTGRRVDDEHDSTSQDSLSGSVSRGTPSSDDNGPIFGNHWFSRYSHQYGSALPRPLDDVLVGRILEAVKQLINQLTEGFVLPASTILDDGTSISSQIDTSTFSDSTSSDGNHLETKDAAKILEDKSEEIELCTRTIIEFISASNWAYVLEYLRGTIRGLRSTYPTQGATAGSVASVEEDRMALVTLRLAASLWVDSKKLALVIQDFGGSYLHLRKHFQHTIAIVVPLLVTRWLDRNPEEFVKLHIEHKRLDGGADTLFDMTNSMADAARLKTVLLPFQNALLFLLPDVFQVASNMRDAKSSSVIKKVAFLEGLRKGLRNRNTTAAYCLISLLRVARHFRLDSDSALLSYALDVQDEVREAIFRRFPAANDSSFYEENFMTAAFVSLAHLNFETCHQSLAPLCLSPSAPQEFKIAYISACCYFARQPNIETYRPLFAKASTLIRSHLKGLSLNRDTLHSGDAPSSVDLTYRILIFLNVVPLTLFEGAPSDVMEYDRFFEDILASLIACLDNDDERIRYLTSIIARKLMSNGSVFLMRRDLDSGSHMFRAKFWRSSSIILLSVADRALLLGDEGSSMLSFIRDYLASRITFLRSIKEASDSHEEIPERVVASEKLETLFLVSLCSADIETCQLVTSCIALLCEESQVADTTFHPTKSPSTLMRNIEVYKELSSRNFRFTGLVAFQKRVRALLRQMRSPSAGILNAWEIVFGKWMELCKDLSSATPSDVLDERSLIEWRNFSGFLASLAGSCISDQTSVVEESGLAGLKWIDRPSRDNYDETFLDRYMTQSIQLLACDNVRIRETTREVLSSEISHSLHFPLFKKLESELEALFDESHGPLPRLLDIRFNFAEQAAALLKTIVERLGSPAEMGATLPIDIGALTLNFARFLNSMAEGTSVLRIKIKVCQLCEAVTRKKELLNLRHDVRIRNQLLEIMFGWVASPGSSGFDNNNSAGGTRGDESVRLQKDLDKASLKVLADLTYRLPLQPADGQSDADTSDMKSQMFQTYFDRFLSLLSVEIVDIARSEAQPAGISRDDLLSTPDLAITALSNLLSANIDVGLKHSLGIGYHGDLEIRTAFVKVLCNLLAQGTELNNLSDVAVNERYDELVELLVNDITVTIALCDACPSTEVDELTISLLNIFDSRGLAFVLLKALIEHEVEETENEAELLRRNCVTTKMLSIFAKWKGSSYLRTTLQKVLERLVVTAHDLDLELDPDRTNSPEELQKNALQLRVVTQVFIDDICNSAVHIPTSFKKICSIISSAVMVRFPEAKFTAVGAFIFLRFFCPAIVAPDAEGLISATPSKEMRRGLMLIAKIVQNLANNVLFGAKESYMFPLNVFLAQNIYHVTTFLREISVPPTTTDLGSDTESFDFGSCVALHRFLYDQWDHVRQKLVARERGGVIHSPISASQGRIPILETLRTLIMNLGPPPMDISWNRPLISANSPPSYSRFQHFMLRNAGRSTESIISTRAVYDGGENKDGLSIICVILRNIDGEAMDYDIVLYCYLKIASRMWHRPFGMLIDATCYNGQNEPQDALFKKLDLLTPSELTKNLSYVYVYNMNSAFRKCFRRILRLSAKSENSAFHPKNVEYHLIGSLPDLQLHFHLSQLHLPKETISLVTDTRFVFQPITRLSKTKGKIEVVIKVGSQFVQVTTTRKQEVFPGLRLHATVNDIFRLSEVDEAPTSIQTEDDSAFGLRTESGKIVMYFTSPKKNDVLQAIRGAKAKYGKDLKIPVPFERLIRPQDVPGTLLNIALTNMASVDHPLRLASYNLLCALCQTFKFAVNSKFMTAKELSIPSNPSHFIVDVSNQLAVSEPQLTADFLNEFFVGWESFPFHQRPLSLAYMAPWLPGLRSHVFATETDGEKAREKVANIFRRLIDVAMSDLSLSITLEQSIWPAICHDELHTEILLDELVKAALGFGSDRKKTDALSSIIISLQTVTVRGKLLSRLRKALNRSSLRPTRHLPDNAVWDEICLLLRLCLSLSFDSAVQTQLYLPELFHITTMLANTGSSDSRAVIHQLLINTIHALCTNFPLEESKLARIRTILSSLSEARNEQHSSSMGLSKDRIFITQAQETGGSILLSTEALAMLLSEISNIAAPSTDLSNAWRSRWMSLVASTAFQSNPAIQPRAFTVMGCLAREDVDDDLLYQVLVALRNSIGRFVGDNDNEMLVAIVTSLTKMMEKLPTASRYGLQLFWLAMSLVRLVPLGLFNCAASFLEAVLININTSGELKNGRMVQVLLQGRLPVEDPASRLDESYGVHFNPENFHFAVCASLVKGLTDTVTKSTTLRVLSTFLEIASSSTPEGHKFPVDLSYLPYLGLVMSRALTPEEAKGILWLAGMGSNGSNLYGLGPPEDILAMIDLDAIRDKELLLNAAIGLVDFAYLEDTVQNRGLLWLNRVAIKRPTVILHLCEPVFGILDDVLLSCQNAVTLDSAHKLLRTLTSNPKLSGSVDTGRLLEEVLDDIGFGGLWRSSTFHAAKDQVKQCTLLTDKLIELIIA